MQLITFSGDRAIAHTTEQQTQSQSQSSRAKRPQLAAKWETVGGKLQCCWTLI